LALAQAQLAINHPNEALTSAIRAYEICVASLTTAKPLGASASTISQLVLRCKKAKWDLREKKRLHRRNELLAELETALEKGRDADFADIDARVKTGEMGQIGAAEERSNQQQEFDRKLNELRSVFAIADPSEQTTREIPDYLVDSISFELMHDPVITKNGNSYERATIIEHLKHSETDPLTREHLSIKDLRPNIALREACTEFLENNKGWVYEW
jgi:STIP1 homology and U-box containing protein 1